jgi:hypothetical protein
MKEELWNGTRETIWKHLFTRDSMILWTIMNFSKNRKIYEELINKPELAHINFLRLCSNKEVENFITENY